MSDWDNLPFYDYDPDARDVATDASRARIKQGFNDLIDALQRPLNAASESERKRRAELLRRTNAQLDAREGFFVPEGCSIRVSPALAERLQPSGSKQVDRTAI